MVAGRRILVHLDAQHDECDAHTQGRRTGDPGPAAGVSRQTHVGDIDGPDSSRKPALTLVAIASRGTRFAMARPSLD